MKSNSDFNISLGKATFINWVLVVIDSNFQQLLYVLEHSAEMSKRSQYKFSQFIKELIWI